MDRLSMLIIIHFTLQMYEVMVKLRSQSLEESAASFKRFTWIKRFIYIYFVVFQIPILLIRFYVRYRRYINCDCNVGETFDILEFVLRACWLVFELFVLAIFIYLFHYFATRKLQLIKENDETAGFSRFHKIITAMVLVAVIFNLEYSVSSFVYSVIQLVDH